MIYQLYNISRNEHIAFFDDMDTAEIYVHCLRLFRGNEDDFIVVNIKYVL